MQRYLRLARMVYLINNGRCPTREDFCREFECKVRTVDEDIRVLKEELQMPIEYDKFKGGYINANPKQKLPEFDLELGEVLALTIGKEMLSEYTGTSLESVLQSALDKIAQRLPEKIRVNLGDFVTAVRFKPTGIAPISRKVFFDFAHACDNCNVIEIKYYSAHNGQHTFRRIEPLRLVENRGAWYCVAWCQLRNDVRMFALHRIVEYNILPDVFAERNIDIDSYLSEAFLLEHGDPPQEYVIKFDSTASRYVRERTWHSSQQITDHADGSCTMKFTATNLDEVKRWVLGYGASAEVIHPRELRQQIQRELERAFGKYATPAKRPATKIAARTAVTKQRKSKAATSSRSKSIKIE